MRTRHRYAVPRWAAARDLGDPVAEAHALALCRQIGLRTIEGRTLDSLGMLHTRLDQPARAAVFYRQALDIFREMGERDGEAFALIGLGKAAQAAAQPAEALTHHGAALVVATEIGDRWQQARAHTGLGDARRTLGRADHARHHYEHALALYTDLDMPDADEIRARLAAIPTDSPPASSPNPVGTAAISADATPETAEQ